MIPIPVFRKIFYLYLLGRHVQSYGKNTKTGQCLKTPRGFTGRPKDTEWKNVFHNKAFKNHRYNQAVVIKMCVF